MVERFDLVQYEHFDQLDRAVNGDWVRYSDHEAELSALKKQVEELTAERDAIYRAAMDIFDETSMFLITEAQAKRSVAAAMNRARAALASTRETSDA